MDRFILMIMAGVLLVQVIANMRHATRMDMMQEALNDLNNRIELLEANP